MQREQFNKASQYIAFYNLKCDEEGESKRIIERSNGFAQHFRELLSTEPQAKAENPRQALETVTRNSEVIETEQDLDAELVRKLSSVQNYQRDLTELNIELWKLKENVIGVHVTNLVFFMCFWLAFTGHRTSAITLMLIMLGILYIPNVMTERAVTHFARRQEAPTPVEGCIGLLFSIFLFIFEESLFTNFCRSIAFCILLFSATLILCYFFHLFSKWEDRVYTTSNTLQSVVEKFGENITATLARLNTVLSKMGIFIGVTTNLGVHFADETVPLLRNVNASMRRLTDEAVPLLQDVDRVAIDARRTLGVAQFTMIGLSNTVQDTMIGLSNTIQRSLLECTEVVQSYRCCRRRR